MPLVPVFFFGALPTWVYASCPRFFLKDLGVHLGVSQGHTHQWGLMGLGCKRKWNKQRRQNQVQSWQRRDSGPAVSIYASATW